MPPDTLTSTQNLQQEKDRFEALFQYASMGIVVAGKGGDILLVNNFLITQFGYASASELVGQKIEKLIPSRYHGKHTHYRDNYNNNPHPRPMGIGKDLFAVKKDGTEFPVEVSLSNYTMDNESYTIGFINDISIRKGFETEVQRQQMQLAETNKRIEQMNDELEEKVELRTKQLKETLAELEVSKDELTKALSKEKELSDLKSRFVSMASHEFRTPLSTILSSASLVAKYTQTDEQERRDKHIQRIKSSVNNLTSLLNEFLSIGKIEDGKIIANNIRFNIREMITALCTELEGIAKKDQQIRYRHEGEETVLLDPNLLRNVITNLVSNAIKFSAEDGIIDVSSKTSAREVIITVQDNGLGISREDQEHLFERFFRGANVTNIQGTGLGLHIVGRYIEIMDGKIEFFSELEKGTRFIITFKTE
ncbi:MAG TPA: PAS domain-containing sensor histidine kinase [Ferruginibacter sp.]|nr:PAS domain-containing sensor histidine kinase [Ferruginibacter sp.]HNF42740.1 PAS domain-containing sensor histidine kinase [Ferruginibacter sp.]HNG62100.1 PAS domain-containing sensor histidine kinase [Ferruginibacter sp.]HNH21278.1 PAS domain-containing sensor histidine kinase [Ferruginibacter sp.]HNJ94313.1 PAS domain-containing sensor histidine kinase [Ferruginibacter sp.]